MWAFSSFEISPRGSGPDLMPFLFFFCSPPLCSVMWTSSLKFWLYRSYSSGFQLVFCEYCSTYKCISGVFVGGGELQVLFPGHLDLIYSF